MYNRSQPRAASRLPLDSIERKQSALAAFRCSYDLKNARDIANGSFVAATGGAQEDATSFEKEAGYNSKLQHDKTGLPEGASWAAKSKQSLLAALFVEVLVDGV